MVNERFVSRFQCCRTVVVGSFFDIKFSKVEDSEKCQFKQTLNYIFCHTVAHVLVAVSMFDQQNNNK